MTNNALRLPFDFPYGQETYTNCYIDPTGFLLFGYDYNPFACGPRFRQFDWADSVAVLVNHRIATNQIYATTNADSATIRWAGSYDPNFADTNLNMSVTLEADGTMTLKYGAGNSRGGIIGIKPRQGRGYYEHNAMDNHGDYVIEPLDGMWRPHWELPSGAYYWRVRALANGVKDKGPWSPLTKFSIP